MKYWLLFALAACAATAHADPRPVIQEEDGSPKLRARVIKVGNGALTDNGDGSVSLSIGSAVAFSTNSITIGGNTMTSGNPKLEVYGYNVTDSTATGGYFMSRDYGASGNNIVFGAYDNATQAPNLRIQVDDNAGAHIGFNIGGTANSAVTVEKFSSFDSDLDGNLNIRGFAAMSGGDTTEEMRFWMNTAGGTIDTEKGAIFMTPATGRLYVQASTLTVSGGNVVISTAGAGITFPDGTRQVTAASGGSSTFNLTLNPDQAKLPGPNPCVISNSTSSITSSLLCDAAADESVTYSTVLEPYGGAALNVEILYSMASATADDVVLVSSIACITPGDSQDVDTDTFGTGDDVTDTVPGTAGHLASAIVSAINDSCAEGDLLIVHIERQGVAAADTATGDIEIRKVRVYE